MKKPAQRAGFFISSSQGAQARLVPVRKGCISAAPAGGHIIQVEPPPEAAPVEVADDPPPLPRDKMLPLRDEVGGPAATDPEPNLLAPELFPELTAAAPVAGRAVFAGLA